MITTLLALAIYTAPCEQFNVCQYQPGYNGPLQPTWEVPPYTNSGPAIACNPTNNRCDYWAIP